MRIELFPFQEEAVASLRSDLISASEEHRKSGKQQIISLQAPTGSGKTIIMSALMESVFCGEQECDPQPDAIFVWLSDSPELNEQSKRKIELKADHIKLDQCITITGDSFDKEYLEDGNIYFLNTQKLAKDKDLVRHSDKRQFTIWETLTNTVSKKADRLYFIIDEAHRGMREKEAERATSIMQRFIKGFEQDNLPPMPVIIGMSATAERFNKLAGSIQHPHTLRRVPVTAESVRRSGLLKERIVIIYPEDQARSNEMLLLETAADAWKEKCEHWQAYCKEQHEAQFNPIFVIQVKNRSDSSTTATDLGEALKHIYEKTGIRLAEGEVVHTFGEKETINAGGIEIRHINPSDIQDAKKVRVVFFKENLSTGWDCPRAEVMMSFRGAQDATYIAQLLGRMVRTPKQRYIRTDDSLNEVRLFLPYFNKNNVENVVKDLQASEGGQLPTDIEHESDRKPAFVALTPMAPLTFFKAEERVKAQEQSSGESAAAANIGPECKPQGGNRPDRGVEEEAAARADAPRSGDSGAIPDSLALGEGERNSEPEISPETDMGRDKGEGGEAKASGIERLDVIRSINSQGYVTYKINQPRKSSNYLKAFDSLRFLLTQTGIEAEEAEAAKAGLVEMIKAYADKLEQAGEYEGKARAILDLKLESSVFDAFGQKLDNAARFSLLVSASSDLDPLLQKAELRLAKMGLVNAYLNSRKESRDRDKCKLDCILFTMDEQNLIELQNRAKEKFAELAGLARRQMAKADPRDQLEYSRILGEAGPIVEDNLSLPGHSVDFPAQGGDIYHNHLYAGNDGSAKIELNSWEKATIEKESKSPDFVCWLRNVPRKPWALQLVYEINGEFKPMYPDFLIIRKEEGEFVLDVVEPHSGIWPDSLAKAKALARYPEKCRQIGRVLLIREDPRQKGRLLSVDMTNHETREKILALNGNEGLEDFFANHGREYATL